MSVRNIRLIILVTILAVTILFSLSCNKTPQQVVTTADYLETRIIGQSELICGAPASLRIMAFDARGMKPVKNAEVTASLINQANQKKIEIFKQNTDERGTLAFNYIVPKDLKGNGSIEVKVKSNDGEKTDTFPVNLYDEEPKINLSTDKPLYQPGQTVHIKALTLLLPTLEPDGKKGITIEVLDSKGNKVMKKDEKTSSYGIASCDFTLADEINLGEYTINATGECGIAKKTFLVKKYVLPKFKVTLETEKKFYQAGDTVEGYVSGKYFFGKPTSDADVVIDVMAFGDRLEKVTTIKGKCDKDGSYKFKYEISKDFKGKAYDENKGYIQLDANIIDVTRHKEMASHQYPLTKDPLTLQVMPEGGRLISNLENNFYLLTSYPDGSPAAGNLMVNFPDGTSRQLASDSNGYSILPYTPKSGENFQLDITAQDKKGNKIEKTVNFVAETKEENILVRSDKTLYTNGDVVKVKVLSTQKEGLAYLDFIRGGHTIFTQALDIKDGQGNTYFDVPAGVFGVVALNAYFVSPYSGVIQDSRNLYFAPQDLSVSVELDKKSYSPGEEAKLKFAVTDKKGEPCPSAIGVDVVDESLFAMFDRRPGMEKLYFLVNPSFLSAPYLLQGLNFGDLIQQSQEPTSDTFSRIMIAQAPQEPAYTVNKDSYAQKQQKILADLQKIGSACTNYYSTKQKYPDNINQLVKAQLVEQKDTKDPWGQEYLIKPPSSAKGVVNNSLWNETWPNVLCLGADGQEGTADDLDFRSYSIAMGSQPHTIALDDRYKDEERTITSSNGGMKEDLAMDKQESSKVMGEISPNATKATLEGGVQPVKVREYFPETLFSIPELITDDKGKAELTVKLADSITTWRMTALANSLKGQMGNLSSGIKVFQDFFIDVDLPVKFTRGDEVSVPVFIYNYLPNEQNITLSLNKSDWFELLDQEEIQKKTVGKEDVAVAYFRIKIKDVGLHEITVTAKGSTLSDAITRKIQVEPDGKKYVIYTGSMASKPGSTVSLEIPSNTIQGASNILLTIYPRPVSQIVEGLDNIFMMPDGCFEQTSSATYPDVLVLDYLKKAGKSSPEVEKTALTYINSGYQRLLSYEIQGGGFQVWGEAPATKVLSAYGLMEFSDMSRVYQIDTAVLDRAKKWLLSQREPDGSWTPDQQFAHAEQWGTIQSNNIPTTAYITWAMAESGCKEELSPSVEYLKKNIGQIDNPYILALCANAFLAVNPSDGEGLKLLEKLDSIKATNGDCVYWKSESLYSSGTPAQVETTSLIIYAMMKSNKYPETATRGLNFLIKTKDEYGLWESTQATVFAMRALMLSQIGSPENVDAAGDILINGEKAGDFKVTDANKDVFQQFDLKKYVKEGKNKIEVKMNGTGTIAYRVAGIYYLPWANAQTSGKKELDIQMGYDKTDVKTTDYIKCNVEVKNLRDSYAPMVMVETGIPPGFDLMKEDIEKMVQDKKVQKYEVYQGKLVIYLNGIDKGKSFSGSFRILAKYPIKAKAPDSTTYLYYTPDINATCVPVTFNVI